MDLERKIYKSELLGEELSLEVSTLAGKANGAVIGRHGGTAVLAAVVMSKNDKPGDFFPLTVDYEERFYAAGKILGSRFIRREGRPSDEAILSGRLVDRTIRPLFDQRLRREVQVTITVISYDEKHDPDAVALIAASTALAISDIPWNGPVGGVRTVVYNDKDELRYDAFFAGPRDRVNMIEFEGCEIPESEAVKVFKNSQKEINRLIDFQEKIAKEIGKKKTEVALLEPEPRVRELVENFIKGKLAETVKGNKLEDLKIAFLEHLVSSGEEARVLQAADIVFEEAVDKFVHDQALNHDRRPDGRKLDELRELYAEVGLFPRIHGTGLFIRGETQILAATTLASPAAEQLIETMEMSGRKRFMLHYNFPGFSSGEVGKGRGGPGRREIGHGALAHKALRAVIPTKEEFPYTIRIVAETLSSNGSTSMASTCAGSLSLMDAGVPIKKHVGGIAMGLMLDDKSGKFKVLTDIQGPEDHHGDMDLKVAGTEEGLTAIQMDVKVYGITEEIFESTLTQAKTARAQILALMKETIGAPREQISPFAPTILTLNINPEKIGEVIGPGGKIINGIIAEVGGDTAIDIEQTGKVFISGTNREAVEKALKIVENIVREYKIGEIVEGPVVKILEFGAIVDLGGGQDGMIHISELSNEFVKKVEDVVKLGDRVRARIIRAENGKIGLSLKDIK
ncbi:MAG: Polyribonucleotide nucleotidyltransferase [Candidatus Jorgensenbacteria bacterium GW2011_GWA1_48_13]|uniref:Polyribonucleotide nucleotidyltransferase n=2 Tax=Candidatus Joergenseniibacteriota TaxID=1752739 RepID=A0A0G1W7M7_9BACT|nr:MAG: Polyribonucleotide nucleotidyltransferase [Candidatus Jorgensenbacteria bacterium GW2011_GWA1_48_13]KKW14771.1 MAG: Polyribonucleotide nucleotidyltransferase [Candidatus Jorgensenbacteria bacterium GW2011_GWB1_50_10]